MRLMRASAPPVAVAVTALLLAAPSIGQVVSEEFAPRAADAYVASPASENSAPPAHINSAQVGWENVWFSGQGAARAGGPSLGSTTRWNVVIGGVSIPDDDLQVGLWELAPRAIYAGHLHPVPEFYVVIDGQAEWTLGDETFLAVPGEVVYIAPNTLHRMVNLTDDPVRAVWGRWAPNGDRSVFEGEFRFMEPLPEQPPGAGFRESGR